MGREVTGEGRWAGQSGGVKALLESQEIILRGAIRARIPRSSIVAVDVLGDLLRVTAAEGTLELTLGPVEAGKWAAALLKPPPSLAQKLGICPALKAFVIGAVDDVELAGALDGAQTPTLGEAAVLIAVVHCEPELSAVFEIARTAPQLALWCVTGKGRHATLADATIRSFLRGQGYVDNKTCAVSERLTATRYAAAKPGRDG